MKLLFEIDSDGYFVGDVIFDGADESLPSNVIDVRPPQPCVKPRWLNGKWIEEDQETLDKLIAPNRNLNRARNQALVELNADYEAAATPLLREYPTIERLSWTQQQNEATAYQAWLDSGSEGDMPATPALSAILKGRNGTDGTESLADLVAAVLRNAEAFIQWQEYTGLRQRGEWMIQAAETVEEAQAVTWESLAVG